MSVALHVLVTSLTFSLKEGQFLQHYPLNTRDGKYDALVLEHMHRDPELYEHLS